MMERHRCKLCHRRFANGRALGGHMKAHLATPSPSPTNTHSNSLGLGFQQQQHSGEAQEEDKALGFYALRENPKRSSRFADSDLSVVQETGSDTESSRRHTRRRSKRKARAVSSEEDVAMCLMMLSRDVWRRRHRCHKCNKAFRSHHDEAEALAVVVSQGQGQGQGQRVFRCPYCCKVFGSGQALGGHKRSCHTCTHKLQPHCFIHLNLPAAPYQQHHLTLLSDA